MLIRPELDQHTYSILLQRYKELFVQVPGTPYDDIPYDIDGHLTEIDTGKIDADYMNANFEKWLKALHGDNANLQALTEELHRSFAALSQDEQRRAELFLHDIERGDVVIEEGKTLRDYITAYGRREKDEQVDKLVAALGVNRELLCDLMELDLTENNINEYGRFDRLKESVNKGAAKVYFEQVEGAPVSLFKVKAKAADLLKRFVLAGGFDLR